MFLKTFFIINASNLDEGLSSLRLPYNTSLCVSVKRAQELSELVKKVYSLSVKISFFISFDSNVMGDAIKDLKFSGDLISLFFHYKYLRNAFNTPALGIEISPDNLTADKFTDEVTAAVKKNGYFDIGLLHYFADRVPVQTKINSTGSLVKFQPDYLGALTSAQSSNDFFFIKIESLSYIVSLIDELKESEKKLSVENPVFYTLLKNFSDLEKEKIELSLKSRILAQRIDSIQNYYSFQNLSELDSRKRISQIVDFYKKEYEVLPLWYKRFGHIIKLLMGRRTFRSLFNDNVKKYKD